MHIFLKSEGQRRTTVRHHFLLALDGLEPILRFWHPPEDRWADLCESELAGRKRTRGARKIDFVNAVVPRTDAFQDDDED